MNEISVAMDEVMAAVKKLEDSQYEFPDPGALAHTSGPAAGASAEFRSALNGTAHQVSQITERIRKELASVQVAIQKSAQDLLEADSSIGGDLTALTDVLESASVPGATGTSASTPAKPPAPAAGSQAAANTVG